MVKIFVDDINEITLEVYTIGYTEKGESQVIILFDRKNNQCLFSFVIDCFSVDNTNITIDILNQYSIEHLDYFIWTHTDEDHSIGINSIIDNFCDQHTQFYLPEGVAGNENDFINYNQEVEECFNKINAFNTATNYNVHTLTSVVGGHTHVLKMFIIDSQNSNQFAFEVIGIAPISALIRRRWQSGEAKKKNDFTEISLSLSPIYDPQGIFPTI